MAEPEFDVVVVGGGGAGLMAAYMAARENRRVILLEKQPDFGGTTGISVGTICTTSTDLQRAAGIADSPQAHFEDMEKFHPASLSGRDNLELRRLLVENVPAAFRVLVDLGIEFVGPFPEGAHRCPRLHAIVPHSRGYIHHLLRACRHKGVDLRANSSVMGLIAENGRIAGVKTINGSGATSEIRARNGVVLATGDFSSASRAFKEEFLPPELLKSGGINPASHGDGQRLGVEAGGEILNGDLALGPEIRFVAPKNAKLPARLPPWRWIAKIISTAMRTLPDRILRPLLLSYVTTYLAPSHGMFAAGAILINREGKRFCNELERPQDRLGDQPKQEAFIVFDGAIARNFRSWPHFISTAPGVGYAYLQDYQRSRRDICFQATSWEELAALIGVPADALMTGIKAYNKEADRLGRPPLLQAPFFALGPAKPWIVFTEGGLRVNTSLNVLDRAGNPIPGLYAAGSAGQGGLLLEGHGHHLGWAFTSGYLAGSNAARR